MNDFFLIERAAQIQRLRDAKKLEIPGRMARVGHTKVARQLFQAIDEIGTIKLTDKRAKWLTRMAQRGATLLGVRKDEASAVEQSLMLTPAQRQLILDFERLAVEFQLEPPSDATRSVRVLPAIVEDRETFDGLKPIQFQPDELTHELLFPSWLNLYQALQGTTDTNGQPAYGDEQIACVFQFLKEYRASHESDSAITGMLTLVARRMQPQRAAIFMQQIMNVALAKVGDPKSVLPALILQLQDQFETAEQLLTHWRRLVVLDVARLGKHAVSKINLGVKLPRIQAITPEIGAAIDRFYSESQIQEAWLKTIAAAIRFLERNGTFEEECGKFLASRKGDLAGWLGLLCPANAEKSLPMSCQRLLARMAAACGGDNEQCRKQIGFFRILLPRLALLHDHAATFFEKEFIAKEANRQVLPQVIEQEEQRRQLADRLLTTAGKSGNHARLLSQIVVAAAFHPDFDHERLAMIGRTATVLSELERNGFINPSQLDGLYSDLRRRIAEVWGILEQPFTGATSDNPKLSRLYLALHEECEKFAYSGEIGNFGLTSAAFGNLNRRIDREL